MNTTADMNKAAQLAIGRILRMGARPFQPGDIEEYERCRAIVMAAAAAESNAQARK